MSDKSDLIDQYKGDLVAAWQMMSVTQRVIFAAIYVGSVVLAAWIF